MVKRRSFLKYAGTGISSITIGSVISNVSGCNTKSTNYSLDHQIKTPFHIQKLPDYVKPDTEILKVGLCQIYTEPWTIEDNFSRTLTAIDTAAQKGAEIAITPECVIHGYSWDDSQGKSDSFRDKLYGIAETLDSEHLTQIKIKAQQHKMYIMIGFVEKGETNKIHNTAALISPKGEFIYVYRKVHCRHFESIHHWGYFTPGDKFYSETLNFDDRNFNIGTMICFDREIPESLRCLRALGAEIVLCPLATNTSDLTSYRNRADNEMITRIRATSNELFIVVVNHAGRFNGGSFIAGPQGEVFCQLSEEPDVIVYDVPLGAIREKFHNEPLGWMGWGYRRDDVYKKYL